MKTAEFKTTWGTITLTFDGDKVVALDLPFLKTIPRKPFVFIGGTRPPGAFKACAERPLHLNRLPLPSVTASHSRGLSRYTRVQCLEDFPKTFPNIGNLNGTDFQKSVWRELKKIPRGQTRTYGEIAAAMGEPKAVRAVGSACGANPLPVFIPCHRVVAKNGLGGFGSGLPWKKLLLELEGWSNGALE